MALVELIAICLVFAGAFVIVRSVSKEKKGSTLHRMILGIAIILFGGFLVLDMNSDLNGIDYIVMFAGLMLVVTGYQDQQ